MSIHYATNANYTQLDAGSKATLIEDIKTDLVAAGWSSSGLKANVTLTYTGQPADNQTITINGTAYQADNTPAGATQFQIGADATATYGAMKTVVEANDANISITVSGSGASGTVLIEWATAGSAGNGTAVTEALNNATLNFTTMRFGGYMLTSAKTAHGMQMKLKVWDDGDATYIRLYAMDVNETAVSQSYSLNTAGGRLLDCVACEYQAAIFLQGSMGGGFGVYAAFGVPFIRQQHRAKVIASVADNGSGLFRVTTSTAHGKTTGEFAYISGATKSSGTIMTALNGTHTVTVIDSTNYDLDGSTYEAGYDANSGLAASDWEISRAYWIAGENAGTTNIGMRTSLSPTSGGGVPIRQTVCANQYYYDATTGTIIQFARLAKGTDASSVTPPRSFGGYPDFLEPRIGWPITASGSLFEWVGDLWNAFVFQDDVDGDVTNTGFDGHNWISFTHDSYLALFLATS